MKKHCGTVALLGLPNAGKSSILNALVGQKIAPISFKPQTTRRIIRGIVTRDDVQIVFVDTPGLLDPSHELQTYMRGQALSALTDVDVVVWVVDVAHFVAKPAQQSKEDAQLAHLFKSLPKEIPLLLALNKTDRVQDKSHLLPVIANWSKDSKFSSIVPISAQKGEGLSDLVNEIGKSLPEQEFIFDADMVTDASERDIVAELIREKVLSALGEEIPHQIAVTIETFDENRREDKRKPLVEISAILHVERESQKKIVIGHGGEKIKSIGMAARKEIEHLLGCQAMLKLFVRVEPDWSHTTRGLRKLGFS